MTVVSDFTAILSGTSVHGSSGKGAFYTFSFLTSVQDYHASRYSAEALASFRPLFASEKAAARIALDAWASQSGLTFFEVPGGEGDIVFGVYDMALMGFGNFAGFAFYPGGRFDNPITSDIFLGSNAAGNMHLLLHEIGHAIGLKHPHEDDPTLEPALDDYSASVMSYKSGGHSGQTLGTLDLQAIHFLYGNAGADGGQVTSWSWDPDSFTLSQTGAAASETILGVGTTDIIVALGGDDFLQGRGGNDRLDGGAGDDQIYGGRGDDVLIGGPGSDDLTGNAGADRFVYTDAGDSTDIAEDGIFGFETGVDKIDLSALGPVTLAWTEGNYGSGGVYSDVVVTTRNGTMRIFVDGRVVQGDFIVATGPAGPIVGTGGDDVLQGTPEADVLRGEAGNDTLHGLGGDDLLDGGSGADRLVGGPGDDRYEIDHGGDLIVEDVGAGTDLAVSSVSYVLAPNVENLTLSGSAAIDATGNGLDNAIAGNEAANVLDGGGGADRMAGGGGNDVYHVDAGDVVVEAADAGTDAVRTALAAYALPANVEILIGTAASGQALTGNDLANELAGGAGNDLLDGAGGADQLAGGAGDDLYLVGTGDTVAEAADAGTDEVRTALAGYALGANVERLTGTAATGQSLTGNALDNAIAGGTGDDLLDGGGGADQLAGGAGSDVYLVDAGDSVTEGADAGTDEVRTALASYMLLENFERLTGTSAAGQTLVGNAADNRVTGGSGADAIDGGGGADELAGGAGDDVYLVDAGDTVVEAAAAGNDEVRTALAVFTLGANVEMLAGSSASGQALTGNALANRISGGAGNDVIDGGAGVDWLAGGLGDDSYFVDDPADYVSELAGVGYDRVYARVSVSLPTGMAIEMLAAADEAGTDPLVLAGNELDNRIVGNAGANTLHGLGGNDRLEGLGGDDMLVMTGADSDVALGGAGNDVYFLDSAGDTVLELAGEGTDEIRTALGAYSLAAIANVENLTGISASGQALSGNDDANRISGGSGNDVIDGRAGADAMHGGAGDDLYFADDGGDVVVELPGGGNDEVRASAASYALGENVETLVGTSNAGQVLSGNFQANVIRAGAGDDTIYAGGGNDALHGGAGRDGIYAGAGDDLIDGGAGPDYMVGQAGDDLYLVDDAGDEALEAANEGLDEVRTAISFALGAHVENLTGTGSSGQILTGNGGDNRIVGGTGDDVLTGGDGNDFLFGHIGADIVKGGLGDDIYLIDAADTIVEHFGEGTDEVRTVGTLFVLGAGLDNLRGLNDGGHDFRGNAGPNALIGAAGNDILRMQDGGDDLAFGKGGVDSFYFGAAFDQYDLADGGDNRDSLILQGNYDLTLVFAPTGRSSIVGIESISLVSGMSAAYGDTSARLYSYDLTLIDDNVAAGALMKVNGFHLLAGENLAFDASAELDAPLQIFAGLGRDTLIGGAQGDAFVFGQDGRFSAGDTVVGGGGYDILYLRGDYAIDFNAAGFAGALSGVESIALLTSANTEFVGGGDGDFDYSIVWNDAMLAAGGTMTVNGGRLQGHETFAFDAASESDAHLRVFGGAGADTLATGAGNDQLYGGGGADTLTGGAGADLYRILAASDSRAGAYDTIIGFAPGQDRIDLQRIDAKAATPDENDAFAFIGNAAFTAAGQLRAVHVSGNLWQVEGDVDGDGIADLVLQVHVDGGQMPAAADFLL